jgi:hypothetical protein
MQLRYGAALVLVLASSVARAQTEEPQPPGGGPMDIDTRHHRNEEPPPPGTPPSDGVPLSSYGIGPYQLGARARAIFVPHAFLGPFLAHNTGTSMTSWSVGIEFIYRRPSFDVVTSLDFSWLDVKNGNYLGAGHDPALDTHYVEFHNLSFLSADVSIIGHHKFLPWLELRYGGGLGLGWVPGDVMLINNGTQCNAGNASDIKRCYPVSPTVGAIHPGEPGYQDKLKQTQTGETDTNVTPHWRVSDSKPPVMGVVNLVLGVRFYPYKRLGITIEGGFRDAMFVGLGAHYLF